VSDVLSIILSCAQAGEVVACVVGIGGSVRRRAR